MTCTGCSLHAADGNYPVWKALSLTRGDSFVLTVRVLSEGEPVPLGTNGSARWRILRPDGSELLHKTYAAADQDGNGFVPLTLLPAETAEIVPGCYEYEVEFRFSDSFVVTAVKGIAEVRGDIVTPDTQ